MMNSEYLREEFFNRIKKWRVSWKKYHMIATSFNLFLYKLRCMDGCIVKDQIPSMPTLFIQAIHDLSNED